MEEQILTDDSEIENRRRKSVYAHIQDIDTYPASSSFKPLVEFNSRKSSNEIASKGTYQLY